MDRRTLGIAAAAANLMLSAFLAGEARAVDPLAAMGGLRPTAPEAAPDLAFTTLDGREVRVRDLRGKPVLLGFFTTW